MLTKEVNLEELVGKKFKLIERFANEKICLDGTIFTENKLDYSFLYRIDLFQIGSVRITGDNVKIDKNKNLLTSIKPSGTVVYSHDHAHPNHNLFQSKEFELRSKYLANVGY